MRIKSLSLGHFRNLRRFDIAIGPRFTVLSGPNGAGKTNVLEALYFTSTLRSFRSRNQAALIEHEASACHITVGAHDDEFNTPINLRVGLVRRPPGSVRTAMIDGKVIRSARDFYARVPMILFTPEDLDIVRGPPSGRRQFLDRIIFARERQHIADVQAYDKLLRARNHILKRGLTPAGHLSASRVQREHLLEAYESGLAEHGARIWARRAALIDQIRDAFCQCFTEIHDGDAAPRPVSLRYLSRLMTRSPELAPHLAAIQATDGVFVASDLHTLLIRALREGRARDIERGTTGRGPHLDDFQLTLDGREASEHASQGQCRALVLALKIAELRMWQTAPPILLLDDVSSELDPTRNARLFEVLSQTVDQCVVTTTAEQFIQLTGDRVDISIHDGAWIGPNKASDSP